jgi:hypothetical protein
MRKIAGKPICWPCTVGIVDSQVLSSSSDLVALVKSPRPPLIEVEPMSYVLIAFGSCLSGSEWNIGMVTTWRMGYCEGRERTGQDASFFFLLVIGSHLGSTVEAEDEAHPRWCVTAARLTWLA